MKLTAGKLSFIIYVKASTCNWINNSVIHKYVNFAYNCCLQYKSSITLIKGLGF